MKKLIKKFFAKKGKTRKTKGQSLVEITLTFPLLLIMLSGLVEFGFMLNYYLSLTDATRETARFFSNFDPFDEFGNDDLNGFYAPAADFLLNNLEPANSADTSRKIALDITTDDVVISVFSVSNGTISRRFPNMNGGEYRYYDNVVSRFSNAEVESRLEATAPDTGILLVEVYYDYWQVLGLPWLAPFLSDPVTLYGYTMMPLSAAEPTPTPRP
jgi:hypothetical protein